MRTYADMPTSSPSPLLLSKMLTHNKVVDLTDDWKRAGELEDDDAVSDVTSSRHLRRDVTDDV